MKGKVLVTLALGVAAILILLLAVFNLAYMLLRATWRWLRAAL